MKRKKLDSLPIEIEKTLFMKYRGFTKNSFFIQNIALIKKFYDFQKKNVEPIVKCVWAAPKKSAFLWK